MIYESQQLQAWTQPGDVGGTGGGTKLPHGTYTSKIDAEDGNIFTFHPIKRSSGQPWDTFYMYRELVKGYVPQTVFTYVTEVMFPTQADIDACEAYEQELQKSDGTHVFNMAYQFRLSNMKLYTFDYSAKQWVDTNHSIVDTFLPGKPVTIVAAFQQQGQMMWHHAICFNGEWLDIDVSHIATKQPQSPYLHCAFQWDSKGEGVSGGLELSDCTIGAW